MTNASSGRNISRILAILLLWTAIFCPSLRAEVTLPGVFSDHMVLQRETRVPVGGTAAPGEKVTVKFRDQEKSATADKDGRWAVNLNPLTAGGPDKLIVSATNTITIEDVLVGEVWVGSGQSNMAGTVGGYSKGDEVLAAAAAAAPYPKVRLLASKAGARWQLAGPQEVKGFSAILFYFGLRLQKELDVPVGLIVGAVGGTPSGLWLSEEALKADAKCQELMQKYAATYEQAQKKHQEDVAKWEAATTEAKNQGKTAPKRPSPPPKPGETGRGKVGHLYEAHIRPVIPSGIRGVVWDQGEGGMALPMVDQYSLMGALIRGWRKDWGQSDFPFLYIQKPSGGGCAWDKTNAVTRKAEAFEPLPAKVPADGGYVENHVLMLPVPPTTQILMMSSRCTFRTNTLPAGLGTCRPHHAASGESSVRPQGTRASRGCTRNSMSVWDDTASRACSGHRARAL
jgi:sialate O-acetylesterase